MVWWWEAKEGFDKLNETDLDKLIKDSIKNKAHKEQANKVEDAKLEYVELIKEKAINDSRYNNLSAIETLYRLKDYQSLDLDEKKVADLIVELKEIRDKHKKIDNDNKRLIEQFKACSDAVYMLCQIFGAKTKYDLTGIIRIPKAF